MSKQVQSATIEHIHAPSFFSFNTLAFSAMLSAAGASSMWAEYARAQTSGTQVTDSELKSSYLTEIIVTARKRSEDVQSVPESIDVLGAKEIADAHITKIDDLGNLVSNLNITTRGDNTPDVVLRGVGAFGVVHGVGFYANDVQLFDGQTVRPDDLERIEVLKGPQGTLYGGSNIGGAIKYVTKLPTDKFEGEAKVEFGNYDTQTYSAIASGPLVPGLLDGRASVFDYQTRGYIYDTTLKQKADTGREYGGRVTFKYDSDATTAILYLYGDHNSTGSQNLYYTPSSSTDYSLDIRDGTLPIFRRTLYSATLNVGHQFADDLTLTSVSSFFHSNAHGLTDVDKGPAPLLTGYAKTHQTMVYSEELRLAYSGSGPFKWLVGMFGQGNDTPHNILDNRSFLGNPHNTASYSNPALYANLYTDTQQAHREYAVFADVGYDIDRWTLDAGLRTDYNNSSMTDPLNALHETQNGTEVTPKISLSYRVSPNVMTYTTIARGFEPGDMVEGADVTGTPILTKYKPETTWSYEAGVKSTLLNSVRVNAAVFYINYYDRLFQSYVFESSQLVQTIQNIGASHNYGGEFDVSTRLYKHLRLEGSFGVTRAIWDNVPYFDPDLNESINLRGRTAPNTPAYQGSVALDWAQNITDELVFGARVDESFVGQQYWDVTDHYRQPAYQLFNLGLRIEGNNKWILAAHVSNLFDVRHNTAFISAAELQSPFDVAGIGRPRLWTVTLSYNF
jgi:iron complex outermembrane recepter protein